MGRHTGARTEPPLKKSRGFTSPARPSERLLARHCAHTCTLPRPVGEGLSHDNMGNHGAEKREKGSGIWAALPRGQSRPAHGPSPPHQGEGTHRLGQPLRHCVQRALHTTRTFQTLQTHPPHPCRYPGAETQLHMKRDHESPLWSRQKEPASVQGWGIASRFLNNFPPSSASPTSSRPGPEVTLPRGAKTVFVEPLGSQFKQSTFYFSFVTTIQRSNYHLYFQRRKLRLRC